MAPRPRILATVTVPADGGQPPHRYRPAITVEVRVSWPPLAPPGDVAAALADAHRQALAALADRMPSPGGPPAS
jgi:hypothetical protein